MLPTGATHGPETQTGQREHPRALFSVPLKLQHLPTGGLRALRGISLDISEGGLGAVVQGALRVGEAVRIDFTTGEGNLRTFAIVRHASSARCGFEFLGLNDGERKLIMGLAGDA